MSYEIKKLPDGKIEVGIPVEWAVCYEAVRTFDSIEDMTQQLADPSLADKIDLDPEEHVGYYIDGSFMVNKEMLEDMIENYKD